jgi:uridine kinase
MVGDRTAILKELATKLSRVSIGRPVRVAVDGRTASGKSTIADEIASLIRVNGCRVIRTSIDGFHRPKAERYVRGRHSAEGYYYDARDLAAVRTFLLAPMGPEGNRLYRTQSFYLENDIYPSNRNRNWRQLMPFLLSMARFFSDPSFATVGM